MNAPENLRLPPHSTESEQSVLGGLLLDNSAYDRIAGMLTDADFYRDDHRRIFSHIRKMIESGKTADVVTVFASIEQSNEVEQTGGMGYLGEIANATPSAAAIHRYAKIIADRAKRRRLIAAADTIANEAFTSAEPVEKLMDDAEAKIYALAGTCVGESEPKAIGSVLGPVVDRIQDLYDRDDSGVSGLATGFPDIDEKTNGFQNGDLIILAGRPSMGKSAIALNIAENVALDGNPVLVFSLEMSDEQLGQRTLASVGSINSRALRSGRMNDDDWGRMKTALGKLHAAPLYIDETPSISVSQMAAKARRLSKKVGGIRLIVIDYLQLMEAEGQNRNDELGIITRRLKLMAKDLNCPVICLSQLSRKVEERGDKRPILSDLRESGAIEQDADVVMMMYRDDYYNENSAWKGMAEVLFRKQRMGETGTVHLVFRKEYSRFGSASSDCLDQCRQNEKASRPTRGGFRDE